MKQKDFHGGFSRGGFQGGLSETIKNLRSLLETSSGLVAKQKCDLNISLAKEKNDRY